MKKIYTLITSVLLISSTSFYAQTISLKQEFEGFANGFHSTIDSVAISPGNVTDTLWYTFDLDLIPDGSGASRPDGWFFSYPYSEVNHGPTGYTYTDGTPDSNTVFSANSWNNFGETSSGLEDNWLVTPSVVVGPHDTLYFKSAPRQTPRYCDGYEVLLSNSNNDPTSFTTVLSTAAENTALGTDTTYSTFTFSSGFVHGLDGTYIDIAAGTNPSHAGQLRPFTIPLTAYAGQTIFVAFHHNSHDDNLISIDDVIIGSNVFAAGAGISEHGNDISLKVSPNPSKDIVQVEFNLTSESSVVLNINDVTGKLIYTENQGMSAQGNHKSTLSVSSLAKGFYTITVQTSNGVSVSKLIVE